uniref:Uncharacterized protein n=1 Tax=Setaria italica TaxID=4555 RepID=K4AHC6_SETIT
MARCFCAWQGASTTVVPGGSAMWLLRGGVEFVVTGGGHLPSIVQSEAAGWRSSMTWWDEDDAWSAILPPGCGRTATAWWWWCAV